MSRLDIEIQRLNCIFAVSALMYWSEWTICGPTDDYNGSSTGIQTRQRQCVDLTFVVDVNSTCGYHIEDGRLCPNSTIYSMIGE